MAATEITLEHDDPTVFAVCTGPCNAHYRGKKVGNYFGKAYTKRKWRNGPKCDNCGSPMRAIFKITVEEEVSTRPESRR